MRIFLKIGRDDGNVRLHQVVPVAGFRVQGSEFRAASPERICVEVQGELALAVGENVFVKPRNLQVFIQDYSIGSSRPEWHTSSRIVPKWHRCSPSIPCVGPQSEIWPDGTFFAVTERVILMKS